MNGDVKFALNGVIPALVAPINDAGSIDFAILEKQVKYLVSHGAHGIFVNGSTGEGPLLSISEKVDLLRVARAAAGSEVFLVAACLAPSTEHVLREVDAMAAVGPDFVAAVTPYYYAPTQHIIIKHFRSIAAESPVPLVLYDIPSNTHSKIALDAIVELSHEKNIAGIKDSSGDAVSFARGLIHPDIPESFSWIQGDDYLDAFSMLSGASGIVTGLGNVRLDPYVALYGAAVAGNRNAALAAQREINSLAQIFECVGHRIIPAIKAAVAFDGRCLPRMKMEHHTLSAEDIETVLAVLNGLGAGLNRAAIIESD